MSSFLTENVNIMVEKTRKYCGASVPVSEIKTAVYAAANEIEEHYIAKEPIQSANVVQGEDTLTLNALSDYTPVELIINGHMTASPATSGWSVDNAAVHVTGRTIYDGTFEYWLIVTAGGGGGKAYGYTAIQTVPGYRYNFSFLLENVYPPPTYTTIGFAFSNSAATDTPVADQSYTETSVPGEFGTSTVANEVEGSFVAESTTTYLNIWNTNGASSYQLGVCKVSCLLDRADASYSLNGLDYLEYNGNKVLLPKTESWLDVHDRGWRYAENAEPRYYFVRKEDEVGDSIVVQLDRAPDESITGGFRYIATCKSRAGKGVFEHPGEDRLLSWYRKYGEIIEFGAAGRLLMQPKRKWTDLNTGKYLLNKFNQMKQEFISQKRRSNTAGASTSVRHKRWV